MNMNELLYNAGEHGVYVMLRTAPFKPVPKFAQMIEAINNLYTGENQQPLLVFEEVDKENIVIVGDTFSVQFAEEVGDSEEALQRFKEEHNVPDFIYTVLVKYLGSDVPVGDLVQPLIAPKQKVTVQLTDHKYGNSEYTIET